MRKEYKIEEINEIFRYKITAVMYIYLVSVTTMLAYTLLDWLMLCAVVGGFIWETVKVKKQGEGERWNNKKRIENWRN